MAANRFFTHFGHLLLVACLTVTGLVASEHHGTVKSGDLPVPGATVTATQGDKKPVVTTTDDAGYYSFPNLEDGIWTISVEALGFEKATKDIGVSPDAPSPVWDLKYATLDEIANPKPATAAAPPTAPAAGAPATTTPATPAATETKPTTTPTPATTTPNMAAATTPAKGGKNAKNSKGTPASTTTANNGRPSLNAALAGQGGGFQRLGVNQSGDQGAVDVNPPQDMGDMASQGADSFTINGSVSSGLGMNQGGGDWMAGGGRGGPGGFGGPDMGGGMGPGGMPGMGGDNGQPGGGGPGGGVGGPGGGGPGGGGGRGGGGGGRGGGGGMMGALPSLGGGGRGGRGGAPGGRGGRGNPNAFGNNRRDPRSRYNFSASLNNFTNGVLEARPFSETGQVVEKPSNQTLRATLTAGGPLKIPHIFDTKGKGTFTLNYSFTRNRNALTFTDLVPTAAEEAGNFSGLPQLYQGSTPIPNNIIPANQINSAAAALEKFFPAPNFIGTGSRAFNYESSATGYTSQDNVNGRLSYTFNNKNQVNGGIQWQRGDTRTPSVFAATVPGWVDNRTNNGINLSPTYIYHFNVHLISTLHYNYSRSTQLATPYWANLQNIEGNLGITGTDQYPVNWGPPGVSFTGSSILGLNDATLSYSHPQTSAIGDSLLWVKGAHEFTFGGDFSRRETNLLSQSNPRGGLQFSGAATALNGNTASGTGSDFADFLLGDPYAMSINYTNSLSGKEAAQLLTGSTNPSLLALQDTPSGGDRYLRASVYDLYATDSWHVTPRLSLSIGVRWDYQAPATELYGRLATIDLPGSFQVPASLYNSLPYGLAVVAGQTGPATGIHYPDSILNGQKTDISPRVGLAYKPWSKHSTVIRSGVGIYYSPSIYTSLQSQLDSQTPFATSFNLTNTAACNANIQNAFNIGYLQSQPGCLTGGTTTTTNAINPDFRVGYTTNWQIAVQQNLKANTVVTLDYFGVKGTALTQQFYPNTAPTASNNKSNYTYPGCAAGNICPFDYLYETSNGNSITNGLQAQLQRRLRSGLGWNLSYTYNRSIDDAPTGSSVQNWQNLAAERANTAGIRENSLNLNLQYSSGVSARGGGLVSGWKGVLFRDWTLMPGFNLASGAPINIYAEQLALGGAPNGNLRVNYIGGPVFVNGVLNSAAFGDPAPGTFGTLGRDALWGPKTFTTSLNALRTFRLADRKNVTFSVNVINPLNHPVVSAWNTNFESNAAANQQFGLPTGYVAMRAITANMRINF